MKSSRNLSIKSVRPLVRYVDEDQAVIDVHVNLQEADAVADPSVDADQNESADRAQDRSQNHSQNHSQNQAKDVDASGRPVDVIIRMTGPKGRVHDHRAMLRPCDHAGVVRFEMAMPRRWWPAGMGDQALYDLTILVVEKDEALDNWDQTIGLTSVRTLDADDRLGLLINGQERQIQSVIEVHPDDEQQVLPAGGDCLLVVREHFGPDVLYSAADRAGILLVQAIPMAHLSDPDPQVRREVDRLASHPSLAGWFVESDGEIADHVADRIHRLDPTRRVLRQVPLSS